MNVAQENDAVKDVRKNVRMLVKTCVTDSVTAVTAPEQNSQVLKILHGKEEKNAVKKDVRIDARDVVILADAKRDKMVTF